MVKFLIEKGANRNALTKDGKTCLDIARQNNQTVVVQFLEQKCI